MENKKHFLWIGLGTIVTFLAGLLTTLAYHAITWAPVLIEIASVTWNDKSVG
jgi:hypothetical protein